MEIHLDPNSIESYQTFLAVKRLPSYKITGRTAYVPDEYAHLIATDRPAPIFSEYVPWPGQFDYQEAISKLAIRKRKFAAFVRPGLGKTFVESEFARHASVQIPKGKAILMFAPPMVIPQTLDEIQRFYRGKMNVEKVDARHLESWINTGAESIGITNYEALKDDTPQGRLAGLVLDECFAKGTKVDSVSKDGSIIRKPIETFENGDMILNASGIDVVSDVHRREVQYAVAVRIGKTRIISSPNHPFFTNRGWVGAQDLEPGDSVLETASAMRAVRERVHSEVHSIGKVLQSILLSEMADEQSDSQGQGSHQGNARQNWKKDFSLAEIRKSISNHSNSEDIRIESDERSRRSAENLPKIEADPPQTFRAWGERSWFDSASEDYDGCSSSELEGGVCLVVGKANSRLSHALQDRLSRSRESSSHRGGWKLPPCPEGSGQEKGREAFFSRVEGIEVLERGNPELEELRDESGKLYFYDLGGTRHPSFSINGNLVHNSSILKSMDGTWGKILIRMGKGLDWKFCGTGTPAPNDRIEYANHAVFLDEFPTQNAFLARYFVNKGQTSGRWELKKHALGPFYRGLADWCIFVSNPSTYGWKDNAEPLPPIHVHIEDVEMSDEQQTIVREITGEMFGSSVGGITKRATLGQIAKGSYQGRKLETLKPQYIRDRVDSWKGESTLIWCKYNNEQETMRRVFPESHSIDGQTKYEDRIRMVEDFKSGRSKILISKPDILGFGLNLQICTRQVFSGLEDSYETFYQAIMRSSRVGSTKPLNVHIPVTEVERPMVENVLRKAKRVDLDSAEQEKLFKESGYVFA